MSDISYFLGFENNSPSSTDDQELNIITNSILNIQTLEKIPNLQLSDDSNTFCKSTLKGTINDINCNQSGNIIKNDSDFIKRKRGRKKGKDNNRAEHDKFARDNLKRKIQVHYLKFLINFCNQIINEILNKNKNSKNFQFYPLNHKFTKNVTKSSVNNLKNSSIGDIIKNNTTPKIKNAKNYNNTIYDEVTKNDIIKNIMNKKYLEFFDIYHFNIKKFDLSRFGLNVNIDLYPNLGFYEDLLNGENDEKNKLIGRNIYYNKLEDCIEKDFRGTSIFVVNKNQNQ